MGFTVRGYSSGSIGKHGNDCYNAPKRKPPIPQGRKIPFAISDEQILEMRRMHEFQGKKPKEIREAFPELNLTPIRLYSILSYETRSKLIPAEHKAI